MVSHEMVSEPCCAEGGEFCGRTGLLQRLAARWSGHRYAYIDPSQCYFAECAAPAASYQMVSVDYGRRFGLGRFSGRDGGDCNDRGRGSRFQRLKTFLGYHPSENGFAHEPNPYHAPARYYFGPSAEPSCGGACGDGHCGGCANGQCGGGGLSGGGLSGGGLSGGGMAIHTGGRVGCGVGGGLPLGERLAARRDDRFSADGRLRTDAGGAVCPGHCKDRPGCWDLAGAPVINDLRFAKNQRPTPPGINASKPYDYQGGWHDLQYMKNNPSAPVVPEQPQAVAGR